MTKDKYYLGIFLISAATLMLEIALIRIFSVIQFYHFAFLTVSIALFGIAAAGTFLYVKKLRNPLYYSTMLFAISAVVSFFILNNLVFDPVRASVNYSHAFRLFFYYFFVAIPFFFSGLIIAYSFKQLQSQSGKLYFYNLSGAALGSIAVLPVMALFGERIILVVSFIGLLAAVFFTKKFVKISAAILIAILLLLVPLQINISEYKELRQSLNYPNSALLSTEWNTFARVDVVNSSFTRYAPGLSSVHRQRLPDQIGVLVDGSNMNAFTAYTNLSFVNHLPTSIGYALKKNPKVLIINAGPGLDVVAGLQNNATITATELNPTIVNLLREEYKNFSGNIYEKASFRVEDGRAFVKKGQQYDIIIISLSGNVLSSNYGLSENYLLTSEAFNDYSKHLTDDGFLVITRWLGFPPKESLRLFSLAFDIDNSANKIAMFRSWTTVTLVLGKKALSATRISKIKEFTDNNRFDLIYLPSQFVPNKYGKFKEPYYYQAVNKIIEDKESFYRDYLFDVMPVYDDKPFYFNFFKLSKIRELYKITGQNWQPFLDPGFLLIFLLIQAIILSSIFILLPLKLLKQAVKKQPLVFFFCIGLAYLFIEIVFIQKFALLFGQVFYSASTVIFSMLLFSSFGSLYSQKFRLNIFKIAIILFILLIFYYLLIPTTINLLITLSLPLKIIFTSLIIAPLAFLMGIPFPTGMRLIDNKIVPWAWAVNGSASVLSTVMAVFIALFVGYSAVLILAALLYLFAALFLRTTHISAPLQ